MPPIVLGRYALLAYFRNEPGQERVTDLLTAAVNDEQQLLLSVVNGGEVDYIARRLHGDEAADAVRATIDDFPIEVRTADRAQVRAAARFETGGGLSYADCFAAGLAHQVEGAVLTGDPGFESVEDEVEVVWLP